MGDLGVQMKKRVPEVSRDVITFRAAPLALIFCVNQSSETWSQVTGEVLPSTPLCFSPLPSNLSLPDADNFICDLRWSWFHFGNYTKKNKPENQRAEASTCAHFNGLNVELCPGLVEELALVGWRRSASLRTLMDLVSVREAFLLCGGAPASQASFNRTFLFPNKPIYSDLVKDLFQKLISRCFSIHWQMSKVVHLMAEAWPRVGKQLAAFCLTCQSFL